MGSGSGPFELPVLVASAAEPDRTCKGVPHRITLVKTTSPTATCGPSPTTTTCECLDPPERYDKRAKRDVAICCALAVSRQSVRPPPRSSRAEATSTTSAVRHPSRNALASSMKVAQPTKLAAHQVPNAAIANNRLTRKPVARSPPLARQRARGSELFITAPSSDGLRVADIHDVDPSRTCLTSMGSGCDDICRLCDRRKRRK